MLTGLIILNGLTFTEMIWKTDIFQTLLHEKLEENSITSIDLRYLSCSSTTLNELLATLYVNIS